MGIGALRTYITHNGVDCIGQVAANKIMVNIRYRHARISLFKIMNCKSQAFNLIQESQAIIIIRLTESRGIRP